MYNNQQRAPLIARNIKVKAVSDKQDKNGKPYLLITDEDGDTIYSIWGTKYDGSENPAYEEGKTLTPGLVIDAKYSEKKSEDGQKTFRTIRFFDVVQPHSKYPTKLEAPGKDWVEVEDSSIPF